MDIKIKLNTAKYTLLGLSVLAILGSVVYSRNLYQFSTRDELLVDGQVRRKECYPETHGTVNFTNIIGNATPLNSNEKHQQIGDTAPYSTRQITIDHENKVSARQVRRLSILGEKCHRLNLGRMDDNFNFSSLHHKVKLLYSEKYKFIICEIPKCATSSMKKLLLTIEGLVNTTDARKVESELAHPLANSKLDLRHLENTTDIFTKIHTYKKILIVRNPIYRLLSAYRSKLETEYSWNKYLAKVSRRIHAKMSPQHKHDGLATFSEFMKFAATYPQRDRHWEFYSRLCLPCKIHFDFIAHVETINEDINYFMNAVNIRNVSFPSNYEASRQTNDAKMQKYLSQVSQDIVDQVFNKYKLDFELFGYSKPWINGYRKKNLG